MKRWVIIPVKKFTAAKSRLRPALGERRRRLLARALLEHTLKTVRALKGVEGILVVSKDRAAHSIAEAFGAGFVREGECDGLNRALTRASKEAVRRGAEAVMVLPADLPLLRRRDLELAMKWGRRPPFAVIAPDRADWGTNLLYIAPSGVVDFTFGEGSFTKHLRSAHRNKIRVKVLRIPTVAQDIDCPEDLSALLHSIPGRPLLL